MNLLFVVRTALASPEIYWHRERMCVLRSTPHQHSPGIRARRSSIVCTHRRRLRRRRRRTETPGLDYVRDGPRRKRLATAHALTHGIHVIYCMYTCVCVGSAVACCGTVAFMLWCVCVCSFSSPQPKHTARHEALHTSICGRKHTRRSRTTHAGHHPL